MATFGKSACIWHAYAALEEQNKSGEVLRSQLKVLTHNIATCLHVFDLQQAFESEFQRPSNDGGRNITFESYLSFLRRSLFSRFSETDLHNSCTTLSRIDQVCWFVCAPLYLNNRAAAALLTRKVLCESNAFKLWRVFNVLAEADLSSADETDDVLFPVRMDWEEVLGLAQRINRMIGVQEFKKDAWRQHLEPIRTFAFAQVLELIETRCLAGVEASMVNEVVADLYETYILGVLKKGYLTMKRPHILGWKERWVLLTPVAVSYYSNRDEKDKRGEIPIYENITIEELSEALMQKPNRFVVRTSSRDFEFSAVDSQTRSEWVAAFKNAIKLLCAAKATLSKDEIKQRRISRFARREKSLQDQERHHRERDEKERALQQLEDEKRRRAEMEEKLKAEELRRQTEREEMESELERARQACVDAMAKYVEKDAQYEMEKQRLADLEELQRHLQILLEKERTAREAETQARLLQDKALKEEFEKKKKLEEMQEALEQLLLNEQQKREDLEEEQRRQEAALLEEKRLLEELENERLLRNKEYEEALAKLHEAEAERDEMKKQMEKKKIFLSKFGSKEPKFGIASHRGVDPGVKAGIRSALPSRFIEENNGEVGGND